MSSETRPPDIIGTFKEIGGNDDHQDKDDSHPRQVPSPDKNGKKDIKPKKRFGMKFWLIAIVVSACSIAFTLTILKAVYGPSHRSKDLLTPEQQSQAIETMKEQQAQLAAKQAQIDALKNQPAASTPAPTAPVTPPEPQVKYLTPTPASEDGTVEQPLASARPNGVAPVSTLVTSLPEKAPVATAPKAVEKAFSAVSREGNLEIAVYPCEHVAGNVQCEGVVWNMGDKEQKYHFSARGIALDNQGHESDIPFFGIAFANDNRATTLVPNVPVRFSITFSDKSQATSKKATLTLCFRWMDQPGKRTIPNVDIL